MTLDSEWSFDDLRAYRSWIESHGEKKFDFKVGVFDKKRTYFDQYGHFFNSFIPKHPESKREATESILGIHTYRSLKLDAADLFANSKDFVRQGDIFCHDDSGRFPSTEHLGFVPTHWIVLSQTCVIANGHLATLAPAFDEDSLKKCYDALGLKPPNPYSSIRENKKARLLALPPHDLIQIGDQSLVIDLGTLLPILSRELKKASPIVSLTFPANAYFANRMAQYLFRDVEGWDDQREPNSRNLSVPPE